MPRGTKASQNPNAQLQAFLKAADVLSFVVKAPLNLRYHAKEEEILSSPVLQGGSTSPGDDRHSSEVIEGEKKGFQKDCGEEQCSSEL